MIRYAAGIDIGGTNTRIALVREDLQIVERIQFDTDCTDPVRNLETIKAAIDTFEENIMGAGLSCPGPLDLKKGIVLTPPNLKNWHFFPIADTLQTMLEVPVYLENDANLACLGEATTGAGTGADIVQYLTVSTGVGSGFVLHGDIYQGAHGFAHEIANMILWKDGPSLGSLKKGSIESIASGTAITQRAREAGLFAAHAGEVAQMAVEGNQEAKQIMEEAKEYLSNGIAALFAINDPDVIIVGGSVALKIDGFVEDIQQRVRTKVYDNLKDYVRILPAQLGDDSGLIGAAQLVFQRDKCK